MTALCFNLMKSSLEAPLLIHTPRVLFEVIYEHIIRISLTARNSSTRAVTTVLGYEIG